MYGYDAENEMNVFHQHTQEGHDDVKQTFSVKILASHQSDAMLRQSDAEAVRIKRTAPDLNRKDERGNSNIHRNRRAISQFLPTNLSLSSV